MSNAGLPGSTLVSLGKILWAAEVGDNDTLAKADERSLKISGELKRLTPAPRTTH